jgi:hypothetical protein
LIGIGVALSGSGRDIGFSGNREVDTASASLSGRLRGSGASRGSVAPCAVASRSDAGAMNAGA